MLMHTGRLEFPPQMGKQLAASFIPTHQTNILMPGRLAASFISGGGDTTNSNSCWPPNRVLACFDPQWPNLRTAVACFEFAWLRTAIPVVVCAVDKNPGEKISLESRVTLHCRPSCRNLVNCPGECRVEMLHYYVADGFGCAVVVVQRPGIQELTKGVLACFHD
jgi:hypothetical protein